jgi:putative transposase
MPTNPYATDMVDSAWEIIEPLLPAAQSGGRPRTTDIRAVVNAIFYLLRTGCQWWLLPREFPAWGTVYHYLRTWKNAGVWTCLQSQSVKTTERGGVRGFDGHKRIKGRKRYILVDTLGIPITCRVEPANMSDQRGAERLLGGLGPIYPGIRIIMADAGHQSRKLARQLMQQDGWKLVIVKRGQRAFKITGLTWIVERSFAWLGRNRRMSKDYEYKVQTSETMIDLATIRLMLNRLAST